MEQDEFIFSLIFNINSTAETSSSSSTTMSEQSSRGPIRKVTQFPKMQPGFKNNTNNLN